MVVGRLGLDSSIRLLAVVHHQFFSRVLPKTSQSYSQMSCFMLSDRSDAENKIVSKITRS